MAKRAVTPLRVLAYCLYPVYHPTEPERVIGATLRIRTEDGTVSSGRVSAAEWQRIAGETPAEERAP